MHPAIQMWEEYSREQFSTRSAFPQKMAFIRQLIEEATRMPNPAPRFKVLAYQAQAQISISEVQAQVLLFLKWLI